MKCARLQLQERAKALAKPPTPDEKPRRYCQKRMINPDHNEDPRWAEIWRRFHCNAIENFDDKNNQSESFLSHQEDMFLTVQNLKFQGDVQERKRPRTSFKYKSLSGNKRHRMFVKQVVDDVYSFDDDRSSQLTSYYLDDYMKYIFSNDRSRPSSSKSSIFPQDPNSKFKEKSTQSDAKNVEEVKKGPKNDPKLKQMKIVKYDDKVKDELENNITEEANVTFHKAGKRKSLTISRAPSPETIQVIRVDVVCNYSSSSTISDSDEKTQHKTDAKNIPETDLGTIKLKGPHFADKFLLTNTIKSVDEHLSCGSKVTLLCKTFKLSDRRKLSDKKYSKTGKGHKKNKVIPELS